MLNDFSTLEGKPLAHAIQFYLSGALWQRGAIPQAWGKVIKKLVEKNLLNSEITVKKYETNDGSSGLGTSFHYYYSHTLTLDVNISIPQEIIQDIEKEIYIQGSNWKAITVEGGIIKMRARA